MRSWQPTAALNNAQWCDTICRLHDAETAFDKVAWTSRTRTPPFYADAVTLVPDLSVPALLARIDSSAGCSIKDSFASLDLTPQGFSVFFEAEWIVRAGTAPQTPMAGPPWDRVRDEAGLAAWEDAWRVHDGPRGLFRSELLDNDDVAVVAARTGDRVVAGAVFNRSRGVVGLSNFFTSSNLASDSWGGCLALADTLFPGLVLVGYESGDQLDTARAWGFETAGPLRVWLRDD